MIIPNNYKPSPCIYDVIVCGGGPAGVSAAIAAAREGMKTLLVESGGCLGGTWTAGLLCLVLDTRNKNGFLNEIISKLESKGAACSRHKTGSQDTFDVETVKVVLEELCLTEGVEILLHSRVTGAICHDRKITAVTVETHGGCELFEAKILIDCTGNGDVAAYAGCNWEEGHPQTSQMQPMSMIGIVSGVPDKFKNVVKTEHKLEFRDLLKSVGAEPSYQAPVIAQLPNNDLFCFAVHHEYVVRYDSSTDITRATINGRKEIHNAVAALKKLPEWNNLKLLATSEHVGIREGRRIKGLYCLTVDDLKSGARFTDGICLAAFGVDIHALDKSYTNACNNEGIKVIPYNIPFRCLVSADIDNLAMAGRCISGDFYAHASYRVIGNAVPMGEAAGIAAAWAVKKNILLKEIDGNAISNTMQERGYTV